jgi:hypothetical protein
MTSNRRIWHETYQCWWKRSRVERAIENCAAVWCEGGTTIRNATVQEAIQLRNEQAAHRDLGQQVLGRNDIHGLTFERPKTTNYQQPWAAYEEMEAPMGVRYCRWPRRTEQISDCLELMAA